MEPKAASAWPFSSIRAIRARREGCIGVVGLGAGAMAAFARPGDTIRFYEINPDVVRLAHSHFTYLSGTPATVEVVPGDARISLEDELRGGSPQQFDVLALDAFHSDSSHAPAHPRSVPDLLAASARPRERPGCKRYRVQP